MSKSKRYTQRKYQKSQRPKLAELDIQFQQALETSSDTTAIVSKKQALRDAPANSAIEAAKTDVDLKAQWDKTILGDSPY